MIGAGSIGFTRRLMHDILAVPALQDTEFAFTDINKRNLDMVHRLAKRDIKDNGLPATVHATVDRRKAIAGADYVFSVVRVGGLEAFQSDIDIPLKYGVDQCVGDTLAPGGIMYAQRGIPVLLDFCKDIREVAAPECVFMNYANPMAMMTWACNAYGGVKTIGLCHGVEGSWHQIANVLEVPKEELDVVAAGINHQTWFISVKHKGKEMTPYLLEGFEKHPIYSKTEKVRIDVLRRFGYYTTESNGHVSEYVPWYRKRPSEIRKWIDLGSWINGETGGYLRVCTEGRNWFKHDFPNWLKEPAPEINLLNRSSEHGSYIVEAMETGRIYRGHFNMVNNGCITNLPDDCVIEAPGYVDRIGLNMPVVGDLPLACAATCNASVQVQRMAVQAAVHGDVTLLKQAMLHDPLTAAVCNPLEIWQMTDAMLVAQAKWLPQYKGEIAKARKRLAKEKPLGTRKGKGAARLKTKSVADMERNRRAARANANAADKAARDRKRKSAKRK
jgi:alpha-galactosidase/6-phospho-beta-glucosidase family protein